MICSLERSYAFYCKLTSLLTVLLFILLYSFNFQDPTCDPCAIKPCHNGTCTPLSASEVTCTCFYGYTGSSCQTNCQLNPACLN